MIAAISVTEQHIAIFGPLLIGVIGLWFTIRSHGKKLDTIIVNVNGRMSSLEDRLDALEKEKKL